MPRNKSKVDFRFEWENGVDFTFYCRQEGDNGFVEIIKAEEDGNIGQLWKPIQRACLIHLEHHLEEIGDAMKRPNA